MMESNVFRLSSNKKNRSVSKENAQCGGRHHGLPKSSALPKNRRRPHHQLSRSKREIRHPKHRHFREEFWPSFDARSFSNSPFLPLSVLRLRHNTSRRNLFLFSTVSISGLPFSYSLPPGICEFLVLKFPDFSIARLRLLYFSVSPAGARCWLPNPTDIFSRAR